MIDTSLSMDESFDVAASKAAVMALLGDIPRQAALFPTLKTLKSLEEKHGPGCFQWAMEPVRLGFTSHQVIYYLRYDIDRNAGTITWHSIAAEKLSSNEKSTGQIQGQWTVSENASSGCTLRFQSKVKTGVPLPRILGFLVRHIARKEFVNQNHIYFNNIKEALS